jgi:hypothetical protein
MRIRIILLGTLLIFFAGTSFSQAEKINRRLKVFLDCQIYCDEDFIRSEINIVDFLNQRDQADVHIISFGRGTGGGGLGYELIFLGQNQFSARKDTLRFSTDPNSTEFERRDVFIKYLKLGLVPFLSLTQNIDYISISMKRPADSLAAKHNIPIKDPWKYWVFNTGISGYYSADAVYQSSNLNGRFSANKITDDIKFGLSASIGRDRSVFTFEDSSGNKEKIKVLNNNRSINQYLIVSLGPHWSWGYQVILNRNTFQNFKNNNFLETGFEYDLFPYKQFNTKMLTISYILNIRHNRYYDTTLYNKIEETLMGHESNAKFTYTQKWGSVSVGVKYKAYLYNLRYYNLGANASCNIRVAGGLSVSINTSAELVHDQIYLPKGGATQQEVLTRRRQLESGYNFQTNIGINYRFGSRLNNFVNPRFD